MANDGSVIIEIDGDVGEFQRSVKQAKRVAEGLEEELKQIDKSLKLDPTNIELAAQKEELLTRAVDETSRALDALKEAQAKAMDLPATAENEAKYRALTREVSDTSQELNRLQAELAEATRDMNKAGDAADRVSREFDDVEGSAHKAAGAFTVVKGAAAAVAAEAAMIAVDAFADLGREALSAADSVAKFQKTLEFGGLDTSTIERARDALEDYANSTTYDMETVLNTGAQLGANGVKDFEKLTIAAGNLNAAASGNAETFGRVALALVQTVGAGKLTTENWNQIADAIPGASKLLQDQMLLNGAYVGNFRDAMERGQITAEEFAEAIMHLGLTDAAAEAAKSTDTIAGAVDNLRATIVGGLTSLLTNEGGYEGITGFINGITMRLEEAKQYIQPAIDAISQSFTKIGEVFRETFTGDQQAAILSFLKTLASALVGLPFQTVALSASFLSGVWQVLITTAGGVVNAFGAIPGIVEEVKSKFTDLKENISTSLSNALESVNQWASDIAAKALEAGSRFVSGVGSTISSIPENVRNWIQGAIDRVAEWGDEMRTKAKSKMEEVKQAIKSALGSIPGEAFAIGRNIVQGLINGIQEKIGAAIAKAQELADAVKNRVASAFQTHSPSRWAEKIGVFIDQGLANGIVAGIKYATRATTRLSDTMQREISRLNEELADLEAKAAEERAKTVEEIQKESIQEEIKALEKVANAYEDAIEGVQKTKEGLSNKLSDYELFDDSEGDIHLWDLQPMIDQIEAYGDAIMALKDRGVSESLLEEVLGMDRSKATAFANELLAMADEQYDAYMDLWKRKEDTAERVSEAVYHSEVEAINAEYSEKLPDLLGESAQNAMGTFSDKLKEAGQGAISVARGIANGVIAELERINAAQRLQLAVAGASASFGAQIGAKANNAAEARIAYDSGMANRTAGAIAMSTATSASRDVVLNVNGKEFARATLDDYRSVEDQSPRIISD